MNDKHFSSTPLKIISKILPWFLCVVLFLSCTFLAFKSGYVDKVLIKLNLKDRESTYNIELESWANCLSKLNYDSDIVFYGDSITSQSDFQVFFKDKQICELGVPGNGLINLKDRTEMISSVSPEKIFVLGGINSLANGVEYCTVYYKEMIGSIAESNPDSTVYCLSVLPISAQKEETICSNAEIEAFNNSISEIADEYNSVYVDLYSNFLSDGQMNPSLTKDGLHLNQDGYELFASIISKYIN